MTKTMAIVAGIVLGVGACVARADTIYMKGTGNRIDGKILRETEDYVVILVYEEHGQVRIPKSKIQKIEYDIKTQLENLEDDDYAGKYKVAIWAINKGMYSDATDLLEKLNGKEGIGPDYDKLLGQCYDKQGVLDKALKAYNEYNLTHPDDADTIARAKELAKQVNPETSDAPKPAKNVDSGLAGSGQWQAETWANAIPCTCQQIQDADGKKIVAVKMEGGTKDKAAFTRTGNLNLKDSKEMIFRIAQNGQTPMKLAIAFIDSKNEFMESQQLTVPPNGKFTVLNLKLDDKKFKSQTNNWQFVDALDNRDNIQRIVFLAYERRPVALWIDGIFFK